MRDVIVTYPSFKLGGPCNLPCGVVVMLVLKLSTLKSTGRTSATESPVCFSWLLPPVKNPLHKFARKDGYVITQGSPAKLGAKRIKRKPQEMMNQSSTAAAEWTTFCTSCFNIARRETRNKKTLYHEVHEKNSISSIRRRSETHPKAEAASRKTCRNGSFQI